MYVYICTSIQLKYTYISLYLRAYSISNIYIHTRNKVNLYTYTHDNYVGCHNLVNSKVTTRNFETVYLCHW